MLHVREQRTLKRQDGGSTLKITDITQEAAGLEAYDGHEQVWFGRDDERGLKAIVSIHNTVLGPALGGTRVWPHETFEAGLTDALRLSRGMTYKSAIAHMPFGGGKAVVLAESRTQKTPALLEAYAEMLASLEGQFYTGEDVGLTVADADFLRERTSNVTGTTKGGSGNPSPVTAYGCFLGLKAALGHRRGKDALAGVRVAVQGLGSVGWALCEELHRAGALLTVTDINAAVVAKAKAAFGAITVGPDEILSAKADIFAPCALGGVISSDTVSALEVEIIAGSANNQLARHEDARLLLERGILYAPDYVINAGGLINVGAELAPGGYNRAAAMEKVEKISATLTDIFQRAEAQNRPTNDVAAEIAHERIEAARERQRIGPKSP